MEHSVIERVIAMIKERNISISSLAKETRIPQTTLNNYIIGKRAISLNAVIAIANSFGVSVDYIVTGEGEMMGKNKSMEYAINKRIRAIIDYYNISDAKFAKLIGTSQKVISNMFLRGTEPSAKTITAIIENCTDVSVQWLMTGEGDMLKSDNFQSNFTALIKDGKNYYSANSIEELKKIVEKISKKS